MNLDAAKLKQELKKRELEKPRETGVQSCVVLGLKLLKKNESILSKI